MSTRMSRRRARGSSARSMVGRGAARDPGSVQPQPVEELVQPRSERTIPALAEKKKVRVVVADDHPPSRDGVVRALTASGQVEVVAEAEEGRTALAEIQ